MKSVSLLLSACFMACSTAAMADIVPVQVDAIEFRQAQLTITTAQGAVNYQPADLEAVGTYSLTTVTPWRPEPAEFVGVLLRDVLEVNGLSHLDRIRVTAENDYAVELERDSWMQHDALIATRVDGAAHSRRARGPLQIVFPMSDNPELGETGYIKKWVWMAAAIEATN